MYLSLRSWSVALVASLWFSTACSSNVAGGQSDGGTFQGTVRVDPPTAMDTLSVTGAPPVSVSFRAYAKDATGTETEVTNQVVWTIDPSGIGNAPRQSPVVPPPVSSAVANSPAASSPRKGGAA